MDYPIPTLLPDTESSEVTFLYQTVGSRCGFTPHRTGPDPQPILSSRPGPGWDVPDSRLSGEDPPTVTDIRFRSEVVTTYTIPFLVACFSVVQGDTGTDSVRGERPRIRETRGLPRSFLKGTGGWFLPDYWKQISLYFLPNRNPIRNLLRTVL